NGAASDEETPADPSGLRGRRPRPTVFGQATVALRIPEGAGGLGPRLVVLPRAELVIVGQAFDLGAGLAFPDRLAGDGEGAIVPERAVRPVELHGIRPHLQGTEAALVGKLHMIASVSGPLDFEPRGDDLPGIGLMGQQALNLERSVGRTPENLHLHA